MKIFIGLLSLFAASASALVSRANPCCFGLTVNPGGIVGQLADGQNRIGGGLPKGTFCIDSNGALTDGKGRGCILTRRRTLTEQDRLP